MITAEQIRAARALLNWKQSDLAKASGLSLPSINNIERMIGSARMDTVRAIQSAFENQGIEFIGQQGVQKHTEQFTINEYQGDDFIRYLYDDVLKCLTKSDDVIMFSGQDDRKFPEYAPDQTVRYYEHHVKTQFIEKALLADGDTFYLSNPENYRWVAPELLGKIPYWLYKNRLAMIMWEYKRVIIIRSQSIVETFEKQFNFLWNMAKPVPTDARNLLEDPTYREQVLQSKPKK